MNDRSISKRTPKINRTKLRIYDEKCEGDQKKIRQNRNPHIKNANRVNRVKESECVVRIALSTVGMSKLECGVRSKQNSECCEDLVS